MCAQKLGSSKPLKAAKPLKVTLFNKFNINKGKEEYKDHPSEISLKNKTFEVISLLYFLNIEFWTKNKINPDLILSRPA